APLIVSAIALNGGQTSAFAISGASLPLTLTTGSSQSFRVSFTPATNNSFTTTVHIVSNDGDEAPFTFVVNGIAPMLVVEQVVVGDLPDEAWAYTLPSSAFTLPVAGGVYTTTTFPLTNLGITQTLQAHFTTAASCSDGSSGANRIFPQLLTGTTLLRCTFTSTNQCTVEPKLFFAFTGGTLNATEGNGMLSRGAGLTRFSGTPAGNPAGSGNPGVSFSGFAAGATLNPANNDYLEFQADLTDRYNIQLSLFVKRESSGAPRSYALYYSADGVNFQPFRTAALVNNTGWQSILADLVQIGGVNNNPNAAFRLYGFNATGATARLTVDDIRLSGAIPDTCAEVSAPLTAADVVTTTEDTPVTIDALANDSAQGNEINPSSFVTATAPAHGTIAVVGSSVRYTPTLNFNGVDSLTYRLCDVTQACATGQITITVTPVNDAPIATDGSGTTAEDTATTITLNATDVEGSALTYAITDQPTHGAVSVRGSTAIYTPTADYNGSDSFTFTASDGDATSNVATISLTVTAISDAPVANNGSSTTNEDTPTTITLSATDGDGDALTYAITNQPAHGTVSVSGSTATYTPTADYNGSDSFTFTASDGGATSNAATVTLTVTAVNDTPVASNGSSTTTEDTPTSITLSATEVEGSPLTYAIANQPAHGAASVRGNTATYTPTADYNGSDSFTFTASDGSATAIAATVSLTVTAEPDLVIALVTQPAYTISFAYSGDGGIGSFSLPTAGSNQRHFNLRAGSYTVNQTPSTAYATSVTCDNSATGQSNVTVSLSGDETRTCTFTNIELLDLVVTQVVTGAAPDADWAFNGPGDVTFTLPAAGGVYTLTDVLGNTNLGLTQTVATAFTTTSICTGGVTGTNSIFPTLIPGSGQISCVFTSVNACVLTPAASFAFTNGSLSATSGSGQTSVGSGLTRTAGAIVGYPQGSGGSALSASGFANSTTLNPANNDYFEFQADLTSRYNVHLHFAVKRESAGAPRDYALYASVDGVTFAPVGNGIFNNDTLWHPISLDLSQIGGLNHSATATFRLYGYRATNPAARLTLDDVTITTMSSAACAEAHPPLVVTESYTTSEESSVVMDVVAGASDVDDDLNAGSLVTVTNPNHGVVAITVDGRLRYTPTLNFAGTDSFRYQLCDHGLSCATGSITITVTNVNDAPSTSAGNAMTNEDTPTAITLSATDIDGDTLTYAIATQPAHGTISLSGNTATYTPTVNYNGSDSFTFTASDESLTATAATVSITVTAVNDAPIASADSASVAEDGVITVTLSATDAEGDALTYAIGTQPAHGTVSVRGGTATYTPTANYNGRDSFTFTANDGNATATAATISLTVTAVNDAPVATSGSATVAEDSVITVTLSASDVDGDALTYAIGAQPAHGTVSV
ncbi:MAG: tandem-95 repeat protein, partial [Caldilineaceae bacterium]